MALADQAVVSAASFLTTIIVSHFTNAGQLGIYAIGISVLATAFTIQGQLISLPYSIQRYHPLGTPAEHAGSSLALSGLLAALTAVVLSVTAVGLIAGGASSGLTAITWALAGVMPFALFRDFCRRFSFTHLQMALALMLDTAVAAIQLSMLGWLGWTGRMSATTACVALGASCAIAAVGWLYLSRADFAIRVGPIRVTMKQSWSLGRWLVASQIMVQAQRYIPYWLAFVVAGTAVTGVFTACMSIVAFANPLFYGLNNLLTQKLVAAWKEGGGTGLRHRAIRDLLLLGATLGPFCLLIVLVGEDLMQLLYRGAEYQGYGHTLTVLALATLAWALGSPAANALATMERPRAVFAINTAGTILTVALVWYLMARWGLLGAAYGWLSGSAVVSAGLWMGFLLLVPRADDSGPAIRVLQGLIENSDPGRWAITRLGEGDHSSVYAIRSKDLQPIWSTHRDLVIKLYKPEAGLTLETVNEQFDSLARLHAALDGRIVNGWTISTPKPLHICSSPLALVMTAVSGRKDLKSSAATDGDLTPDVLDALGRTFVAAMQDTWARGQLHGDLALQNILYDVQAKTLSFIDPGTRECCSVCNDVTNGWPAAALELGHIVRDLGTDVRDLVGNPIARLRRHLFVESALRAFIDTIGPLEDRQRVLAEIEVCARAHLSTVLERSWSLRGLRDWLLTQLVVRRMNSMLGRLRAELNATGRPLEDGPRFPPEIERMGL